MAHAKLSPSGSKIWMACPGQPDLASQVPYSTSYAAASGTFVHSMSEMLFKDRLENVTLRDYWLGRKELVEEFEIEVCLLYTSPSPRDYAASRMPSSA